MTEKEFIEYVDRISKEVKEQIEKQTNIPSYIKELTNKTHDYLFYIIPDRVKFLKRSREIWPENEIHHTYPERCQAAKRRQHFHGGKIEMIYLVKGHAINYMGSKEIPLKQGDLCLMGKSVYHAIALDEDAITLNFLVDPQILKDSLRKKTLPSCSMEKFFLRNIQNDEDHTFLLQSIEGRSMAYNLLQNLLELFRLEFPHQKLLVEQIGLSFLVYIICLNEQMELLEKEPVQTELDAFHIYEYINRHYLTASLHTMAEEFHYSPSVLSKIIKKETGLTFSSITRKMKLEKSQELLANTSSKIEDIASYLNYTNRFTYERAFREMFGISPKEYRDSL